MEDLVRAAPGGNNTELSRRKAPLVLAAAAVAAVTPETLTAAPDLVLTKHLQQLMRDVMHSWDGLNPLKAAPYYAKDPQLVFYDDSPLKYDGWAAYAKGVPKEFAAYKSFKTTLNNDTAAHVLGGFAWGTATWRADAVKANGSTELVYGRWTVLFEKRGQDWLIIHEHVSVPTS